jgi:hypothetical protein
MEPIKEYFLELQRYNQDLNNRLSLNQQLEIAQYVNDSFKGSSPFLGELETEGVLTLKNSINPSIIKQIKNKVEYFIENRINLNPIRKTENGYLGSADGAKLDFLEDLTDLEKKTPTVSIKDPLLTIEEMIPVIFNENVIKKITSYFKTIPIITFAKIVKHFPNQLISSVNDWHFDGPPGFMGSARMLKAIYYLDDIQTKEEGPYCYVKGSHNDRLDFNNHTFSEDAVFNYYSKENIREAYGNIGDTVIAKGEVLHKGQKPTDKSRTLIIVNYCIHDELYKGKGGQKVKMYKKDINKLTFPELSNNLEII